VRGTGVDTRRAALRPKYDDDADAGASAGVGATVGLADDAGVQADLGPEARRKDHWGMRPPLDLHWCFVVGSVGSGPVMMGAISSVEVVEDRRGRDFWNGRDSDRDGRGEELDESDSMADSRQVSSVWEAIAKVCTRVDDEDEGLISDVGELCRVNSDESFECRWMFVGRDVGGESMK